MRPYKKLVFYTGCALCLTLALAATAPAASSLSNSLTGFTGDSTQAGTQAALATAGIEFASTAGLDLEVGNDPTVAFDANGATVGSLWAGDGGRNYMRTIESDYAFSSFVAEVTIVVDTLGTDDTFFGMGSGEISNWGTPDFAGVPTVFIAPQDGSLSSNAADGISGDWWNPPECTSAWCSSAAPGLVAANPGTHRLRMTLNADTKQWVGSIDVDYAGGPFVADVSTPTYTLTDMYDDGGFVTIGWPTNPSRIYFGGDDGAIFKDFTVALAGAALLGDYNEDNVVNAADYTVWRDLLGTAGPLPNDSTPDMIDSTDYDYWKAHFGETLGGGSIAGGGAVPEPAAGVLLACALSGVLVVRRHR